MSIRLNEERPLSSNRNTAFSPKMVGVVEIRTSSSRPSTSVWNWPSCGRRFSTMFMAAMILSRLTTAGPKDIGSWMTSLSEPSIR